MKKLRKVFSALNEIIRNPSVLNYILNENTTWQRKVSEKYSLPNGLPQIQPTDLFSDFSDKLHSISFLGGVSLATDLTLLKWSCRKFEKASYFEIGTWRGESVCNVADVATECYTLRLSKRELMDKGFPEKYADAHAFFSKKLPNVTHLEGDSLHFDYAGLNKKFDVIFIDGNHHYDYVKADTENVWKHLVHENSVIVWHDYAFNPENVRFEVMQGILDGMPKELHHHIYHVANTQCAVFVKGEFNSSTLELFQDPKMAFDIELKPKML